MLDKFLSNKIASTLDNWTDGLILIATIFNRLDGMIYNRAEIDEAFETISTKVPDARDASDYRDKYSAYGSFLGIVNYEAHENNWICRVSPQAKELLCGILPDPQAYIRLQMSLLQYPNPIGGFLNEDGTLRPEHNSQAKRVEQVHSGMKTVPFRLLLRVLLALHNDMEPNQAYLTNAEVWHCLFTQTDAIGTFDPDGSDLARQVMQFRSNPLPEPHNTEAVRNLHILNHTGLVYRAKNSRMLQLLPEAGNQDSAAGKAAHDIAAMTSHFFTPNINSSADDIKSWASDSLANGSWADYYSGTILSSTVAESIRQGVAEIDNNLLNNPDYGPGAALHDFGQERRARSSRLDKRPANAQETEALREKANLAHRELVKLLADRLRAQNVTPESNVYVDLACRAPKKMLFEIKSCGPENLLSQVRKGVSQLYEYRYRHHDLAQAKLVLALEARPTDSLEWLIDYLVDDRSIAVCWLEGNDNLACPSWCQDCLGSLVDHIENFAT